MKTAGSTTTATAFRLTSPGIAFVALILAAFSLVACGEARTYEIGEGAPLAIGYEEAYVEAGGVAEMGRPTSPVEHWSYGCRQLLSGGRSRTAVLLQHPCGENQQVFAVSGDFWDLYRKAGGEAPTAYGFPLGHRGQWKGGWTQGFGRDFGLEAFFMQRDGGPPHILSGVMLLHYLSFDDRDVRFGYPTSEQVWLEDGRYCQRFEQGALIASPAADDFSFELVPATAPSHC